MAHCRNSGALPLITFNNKPKISLNKNLFKHTHFIYHKNIPFFLNKKINQTNFPLLKKTQQTIFNTTTLHLNIYKKPKLNQNNTIINKHTLHNINLLHKQLILQLHTKTHNQLHHHPIIPTTIKKNHFPYIKQLPNITLKIPLPTLFLQKLTQNYNTIIT